MQEFYRLRSSLRAKREHATLLEDFREFDHTILDLEEAVSSTEQALLREHATVGQNTGQVCKLKIKFIIMSTYRSNFSLFYW